MAPTGVRAAHPAFDAMPHTLINAIITEQGVVRPPFAASLPRFFAVVVAGPRLGDVRMPVWQ